LRQLKIHFKGKIIQIIFIKAIKTVLIVNFYSKRIQKNTFLKMARQQVNQCHQQVIPITTINNLFMLLSHFPVSGLITESYGMHHNALTLILFSV
jgi:hypothetical protein